MPAAVGMHVQPRRDAGVGSENAGTARIGEDRHSAPSRKGLRIETCGDVEHLVDGVGPNDACLLEEAVDGQFARAETGRMACRRAETRRRPPRLHHDNRLRSRHPARELAEPARVAERLEIEQHDRRGWIVLGVLQKIVAGNVGLVAETDKRREADLPGGGEIQHGQAEPATLRGQRDPARAAAAARRTTHSDGWRDRY